jgi:hypothetical protein
MRPVLFAASLAVAVGFAPRLVAEEPAWIDLLKTGPDTPWKKLDAKWVFASAVELDSDPKSKKLKPTAAMNGPIWVNGPGSLPDLITKASYGDLEAHVEFVIGRNSNAGVKFHALYEIQILDSAGKPLDKMTGNDAGGIYPRAEYTPKYHHIDTGIPPKVNAAKPAGEWQTLDAVFLAPRFDDKGNKTANAKLVKAVLNGQVVQEDTEFKTPTGANYTKKESSTGPFMLQTDHGPVAFRNVRIRPLAEKK